MSRGNRWPGWQLDPDLLDAIPPEPEPPPRKRGTGCAWLAAALVIVLAASVVPAPQGAAQPLSSLDPARVPAAGTADVRAVGDTVGPLPGAPEPVAVSPVTLAGAPQGEASSFVVAAPALRHGVLSFVDAKYGADYLALPEPRGTVAEICGPADCVTRRSTDYGPDQRAHPDRIADLSAADFVRVCGVPLSAGLCRGTVEIEPPVDPADDEMRLEDRPLPATSTEATP